MGLFDPHTSRGVTKIRHYYTKDDRFEQSIDVYSSIIERNADRLPVVVLVVGSAWMGHRRFVYFMTSWWNSSGPKTVSSLGTTCICIRHRGAFCFIDWKSLAPYLFVLLGMGLFDVRFLYLFAVVLSALTAISLANHGAATLDDMHEDVATALTFIQLNKTLLASSTTTNAKFVFGGYSSGGHVAATLLQNDVLWKRHSLAAPTQLFSGILYISAVLSVRKADYSGGCPTAWLTNLVMWTVWGPNAHTIPSPLVGSLPKLPHVLIGNVNEVFGLGILDAFFSSEAYVNRAKSMGVPAIYRPVPCDHWNILASRALRDALEHELPKLADQSKDSINAK
jgi:acetyl esterase/lipase